MYFFSILIIQPVFRYMLVRIINNFCLIKNFEMITLITTYYLNIFKQGCTNMYYT